VIIGGVLGPITRPDVVIAGLYRGNDLVIVGRTCNGRSLCRSCVAAA
jgi:hypothetical protein